MVGQPGFFDLSDRYAALSAADDPLERLASVVDFEVFRGPLIVALTTMSNWNFEDMGDFTDDAAAERWAKRNDIDLRDIRTTNSGKGVRLEVRRSSLGDSRAQGDLRDGRRTGW